MPRPMIQGCVAKAKIGRAFPCHDSAAAEVPDVWFWTKSENWQGQVDRWTRHCVSNSRMNLTAFRWNIKMMYLSTVLVIAR